MSIFTPVIWEAIPPEANSFALNAGAHAVSTSAAVPSWSAIAAGWTDAALTCTRVAAELGISMEGLNGAGAIARVLGFFGWVDTMAAMSVGVAAANELHSAVYTVASMTMPTAPEIAAVDTARAAAYAHGGIVDGSAELAEAAYTAMHFQAAETMNVYEAANAALMMVPVVFPPPPPIVDEIGDAASFVGGGASLLGQAIQGAMNTAPAVQAAMAQIGSIAGTGASVVSSGVEMGTQAVSSIASGAGMSGGLGLSPASMAAVGGLGAAGGAGTLAAVSFGGMGGGLSSTQLPVGWGGTGAVQASAVAEAERPVSRPSANNMMGQQRRAEEEEEQEHETPDYLKTFEHFADGRTIGPAVLGVRPEAEPRR